MKESGSAAVGKKRKKKHTAAKVLMFAAAAAAAGIGWTVYSGQTSPVQEQASYRQETVKYGSVISGITESGSVTLGTVDQEISIPEVTEVSSSGSSSSSSGTSSSSSSSGMASMSSAMTGDSMASFAMTGSTDQSSSGSSTSTGTATELEVEEVYVSAGQVVEEGEALLKITEDSISAYREQLEAAVESAQLVVTQEEINVQIRQAEADYTYEMYLAEGETALETYEATITSLENEVADLEEELSESADAIAEYKEELEAGSDVEEELEEEELNYSTIEANLQIAKNHLTTQSIEAKQTYENARTNYEYADQLYAIDTDGLEDDLEEARETLQEAQEALGEFEEIIGDGVVYAEYSGTVTEVAYSAGDTLTSDAAAVTFSDDAAVTITVSVAQDDISQISTGDTASIALTAYDNVLFEGEVTGITTATSMGSSTVNYEVEVTFTGDVSKVYSGMTGEVTFVTRQETDTLYVSNRAVYQDGSRSYVKVLEDDGSLTETTIETGYSNGTTVAVLSGLSEGQTVIIESQVTG